MAMEGLIPRSIVNLCGAFVTLAVIKLLAFSTIQVVQAGNTTCAGNLTDWYTNAVGETACETYQRLRKICNQNYEVPSFRPNTPGDQCDDQLQNCCCNSISWALSMLCMNCQWDVIGGSINGIDAGKGAYQLYRNATGNWCSPATNQSLPTDVQSAVCNTGIKLDNFLYDLFWNQGDWYFAYTMEYAGEQQAEFNNNTFTHCNSTTSITSTVLALTSIITAATSPSAPPTTATSTTPTPTPSPRSNTASTVGGVVGGIAGLALIFGAGFICWRRRRGRHQTVPTIDIDDGAAAMSAITPYPHPSQGHSAQTSSGFTRSSRSRPAYTDVSSDLVPRSDASTLDPSQMGSGIALSDPSTEPARHDDFGPVPSLYRSESGRLPPAYNPDWDSERPRRPRARPLPQPMAADAIPPASLGALEPQQK